MDYVNHTTARRTTGLISSYKRLEITDTKHCVSWKRAGIPNGQFQANIDLSPKGTIELDVREIATAGASKRVMKSIPEPVARQLYEMLREHFLAADIEANTQKQEGP